MFETGQYHRSEDFQVNLVWHQDLAACSFLDQLINVKRFPNEDEAADAGSSEISLEDCFREFKQSEQLDEDNKWYCNKCKEHVRATVTLELFKVPRILIVSLKRFRKSSRQIWGGSKKIDTHVQFPLDGLDMSPFVLSKKQKEQGPLIYDCFAVSNHFGGVGGGHYTAFGKNCFNGQWYDFDDSHASPVSESKVVTSAAYSLFYRLRNHVADFRNINHEEIV